jgi:hypothetical protein
MLTQGITDVSELITTIENYLICLKALKVFKHNMLTTYKTGPTLQILSCCAKSMTKYIRIVCLLLILFHVIFKLDATRNDCTRLRRKTCKTLQI